MEREERQQKLDEFGEKVKAMTNEQLIALSVLIRRGTLDLTEEMQVLQEIIKERQKKRSR